MNGQTIINNPDGSVTYQSNKTVISNDGSSSVSSSIKTSVSNTNTGTNTGTNNVVVSQKINSGTTAPIFDWSALVKALSAQSLASTATAGTGSNIQIVSKSLSTNTNTGTNPVVTSSSSSTNTGTGTGNMVVSRSSTITTNTGTGTNPVVVSTNLSPGSTSIISSSSKTGSAATSSFDWDAWSKQMNSLFSNFK